MTQTVERAMPAAITRKDVERLIFLFQAAEPDLCESMADPEAAKGACHFASQAFADFAKSEGVDVDLIVCEGSDATFDTHAWAPEPVDFTTFWHVVARIGDLHVDWSIRQLDVTSEVPRISTEAELRETWKLVISMAEFRALEDEALKAYEAEAALPASLSIEDLAERAAQPAGLRIGASAVLDDMSSRKLVHHATRSDFPIPEFAPFSHFGTLNAARSRAEGIGPHRRDVSGVRLVSAFLDIRNPLDVCDINDTHDVVRLVAVIGAAAPELELDGLLEDEEMDDDEVLATVAQRLLAAGHDGLVYRNLHEDPGSLSWVILDASQIVLMRDGPLGEASNPWDLDFEAFLGPHMEAPVFAIDGRCGNWDHLWEEMEANGGDLPVLARDGFWTARLVMDFEPWPTLSLHDPSGKPQGFSTGGMLWLEPEARGAGRSSLMIAAAADLNLGPAIADLSGIGFSPEGLGAYRRAHREIRASAEEMGYELPEDLCEEDDIPSI
jgi:hypothetical protein